jgi:hypothetical protein
VKEDGFKNGHSSFGVPAKRASLLIKKALKLKYRNDE